MVTTVYLAVVSYAIALVLGLIAGLGRVSRNTILYTLATLYVEVIHGIPLLVIILYAQFVIALIRHDHDTIMWPILDLFIR
jgi:polar amino acid transport system permease protein